MGHFTIQNCKLGTIRFRTERLTEIVLGGTYCTYRNFFAVTVRQKCDDMQSKKEIIRKIPHLLVIIHGLLSH
jgi:hypothetical protein